VYPLFFLHGEKVYLFDLLHSFWLLLVIFGPVGLVYFFALTTRRKRDYFGKFSVKVTVFALYLVLFILTMRKFPLSQGAIVTPWLFALSSICGFIGIILGGLFKSIKVDQKTAVIEMVMYGVFPAIAGSLLFPIWYKAIRLLWSLIFPLNS